MNTQAEILRRYGLLPNVAFSSIEAHRSKIDGTFRAGFQSAGNATGWLSMRDAMLMGLELNTAGHTELGARCVAASRPASGRAPMFRR